MQASAATVGGLLVAGSGRPETPPEALVCPKSAPPVRQLCAFRMEELTSFSWDMRLTLSCLQGLVNRSKPRLYLVHDYYDELWLDWLRERGDVDEVMWLEIAEVFGLFLPEAKVVFVTDPAIPASINVATMLASVHEGLVATPPIAGQFDLPMGHLPDSWNMGMDLGFMNWKRDLDAYRWAFEKIGDQLSRRALAILDPHEVALRDYLLEFKIPNPLDIGSPGRRRNQRKPRRRRRKEFAREILMKWPANIPCFGWPGSGDEPQGGIGEWEGVRLLSECGKFETLLGLRWLLSHGGKSFGPLGNRGQGPSNPLHPCRVQRDKVYFCFTRSDGDGWNFQRHYYRKLFHGSVAWPRTPSAGR